MSEKNTPPKFKQKNIRNYFKLICTTQLIVENENDRKFITDLLMGKGSPDNPHFNKRDELKDIILINFYLFLEKTMKLQMKMIQQ